MTTTWNLHPQTNKADMDKFLVTAFAVKVKLMCSKTAASSMRVEITRSMASGEKSCLRSTDIPT